MKWIIFWHIKVKHTIALQYEVFLGSPALFFTNKAFF